LYAIPTKTEAEGVEDFFARTTRTILWGKSEAPSNELVKSAKGAVPGEGKFVRLLKSKKLNGHTIFLMWENDRMEEKVTQDE